MVTITATLIITYSNHVERLISENIKEYDELKYSHLCNIAGCTYAYTDTETFKNDNGTLFTEKFVKPNFVRLFNNVYYYNYSFLIYSKSSKAYYDKDYADLFFNLIVNLSVVFLFFYFAFSVLIYRTYKRERTEIMMQNIGNEAILANKSMVMITENVHHELNTPIEVIENKMEKIHRTLNNYIISQNDWILEHEEDRRLSPESRKWNKKIIKLEKDSDYVHTSIESVLSVLAKMKNFKSLRYSNGDKTVHDIIRGAFKIISVSNTDFDFMIDERFKRFKMRKDSLKNIDLLNILINHIKNSIEANSTMVTIDFKDLRIHDSMLTLIIIDNGTGIPQELRKHMFTPNFSSKQIGDSVILNILRDKKYIQVTSIIKRVPNLVEYEFSKKPRYIIYGGLVFAPITKNYLRTLS